jgi:hypothetical protein
MHGQSGYTPTKQKHLSGLLNACTHAWNPQTNGKPAWAHPEVIIIDCTSGNGHNEQGEPGSPLIINEWAARNYGAHFKQLCCERMPSSFAKLWHIDMPQTDVIRGSYQEVAPQWLDDLKVTRPVLGFVYCDPNGAKDLIEGLPFFRWIMQDRRFCRLDFIFHWSMNAYNRNAGVGNVWAQTPVLDVVGELASLKRYAYMREPVDKWQWVFMQVINTDKVRPIWKSERIVSYTDWKTQYGGRFAA